MILADWQIKQLVEEHGVLNPFVPHQVREVDGQRIISYGLSSYGYDIRCAEEFKIVDSPSAWMAKLDPKCDNTTLFVSRCAAWLDIPPHGFVLARSVERFKMPRNVSAVVWGKSTYARVGLVAGITPIEAGWEGYLTLELSNTTSLPVRVYANEGIAQVVFHMGEPCEVSYADRRGKYQGQPAEPVLPRV